MHVLPQLRKLEQKYEGELAIIGVHSGKFSAERITENIRQAALRLDVHHPVVNDRYFRIWRAYHVDAWPTLVFIDPKGHQVGLYAGEITFEELDPVVDQIVGEFDALGELDRTPFAFPVEKEPPRVLAFPSKVLATPNNRLAIADTRHDRVLVVAIEGDSTEARVEEIIGRGEAGFEDGDFGSAALHRPQGLALVGYVLYIADTENHAIRAADLRAKRIETIAGTGQQARYFNVAGAGTRVALNSPWDLVALADTLYIAMAGSHQIWSLDLQTREARPFAGSGFEALTDGPPLGAALAQPSGITTDGNSLYFADSESSAIRRAKPPPADRVQTIVGKGLFDFGDRDGIGSQARLQHSQGITWHRGLLYVADTYNNKIKIIDPSSRQASTFLGSGEAGLRDGDQPLFYEPGGIAAGEGRLFIADTNNHSIRVADLKTRTVGTLSLKGI